MSYLNYERMLTEKKSKTKQFLLKYTGLFTMWPVWKLLHNRAAALVTEESTTTNIVKLNVSDLPTLLDNLKCESSSIASGTLGR